MKNFLAAAVTGIFVLGAMPASALDLVQNFENYQITTQTRVPPSPQEVRDAIIAAGSALDWRFADEGPARLRGTLVVRGRHTVEVAIPYSAERFSVLYTGSDNMRYDASTRMIHPNYNVWARQLVDRIAGQLSSLAPQAAPARHIITAQGLAKPASDGDALVEVSFWESVRGSSNPAELQAYLDQYPNGKFAVLARARLAALGGAKPPPAAASPAAPAAPPAAAAASGLPSNYPGKGDVWTYRFSEGRRGQKRTYEVVADEVSAGTIVDRLTIVGQPARSVSHRPGFHMVMQGAAVFAPYLPVLNTLGTARARLPGIQHADDVCPHHDCSSRGSIAGREVLHIAGRSFETTKVIVESSWQARTQQGGASGPAQGMGGRVLTVWYAPEVKRAVKVSSKGFGGQNTPFETDFDLELTSYKLN